MTKRTLLMCKMYVSNDKTYVLDVQSVIVRDRVRVRVNAKRTFLICKRTFLITKRRFLLCKTYVLMTKGTFLMCKTYVFNDKTYVSDVQNARFLSKNVRFGCAKHQSPRPSQSHSQSQCETYVRF